MENMAVTSVRRSWNVGFKKPRTILLEITKSNTISSLDEQEEEAVIHRICTVSSTWIHPLTLK